MKWEAEGGKELFRVEIRKGLCERNAFGLQKSWRFLLIQGYPIKKKLFQRTTTPTSHYTKANEQSQILSAKTYCKLAVYLLFFEKHPSCVCTTITLSHRFKAFSPAFCRQNRFRHVPPEIFAKFSGGSYRNRFCLQNAGEKALNRCERVTVVQTQD